MTFYYFINHTLNDKNITNFKKLYFFNYYIDKEIKTNRFKNNSILSNEILKVFDRLYKFYKSKYVFTLQNINFYIYNYNSELIQNEFLFLQLLCESYFLEEHPIYLLDKLMKNPVNYKPHISRLLNYNIFDEFITLKSYMKTNNKIFFYENNNLNFKKNISHEIYLIHINNTCYKSYFIE